MMFVDLQLTTKQSTELLAAVIAKLPQDELFAVLNQALTTDVKEQLGEQWFNINRQ